VTSFLPWLFGIVVLAATAAGLWVVFVRRDSRRGGDPYQEALEAWIGGDLESAEKLLRLAVKDNPESVDPFLQLGNLLRTKGDCERAAFLHRSLTVRSDLPREKKILVGLSLAEDLLALRRWDEAKQTLDTVSSDVTTHPRYWRARFQQWVGMGHFPDAARTLKLSLKQLPVRERPWFSAAYASFQLDRALEFALAGNESDANPRLKDVSRFPEAAARAHLVKALMAAVAGDAEKALALGAEHLMDSPRELAIFLPVLQDVLLNSGQYMRSIPLLERACQEENAPSSLWIDLALLYEKLGQREQTLQLLESKSGRPDFTPNVAAPLLRLLFAEAPGTDVRKVWEWLDLPTRNSGWSCSNCATASDRVRWFCPDCLTFDSYVPHANSQEVS
jgi:lipopolysaccharide assembly protein B